MLLFYTEPLRRPYVFFYKERGSRAVLFTYCIGPRGGGEADALVRGNLLTATVEAAKRYVQGMTAPTVKGRSDLEVILLDTHGKEVFRCPHKGSS